MAVVQLERGRWSSSGNVRRGSELTWSLDSLDLLDPELIALDELNHVHITLSFTRSGTASRLKLLLSVTIL